jgi:uncharacterized protein YdhG (YjbR/CyaY superfamily)
VKTDQATPASIEAYIAAFPVEIQALLNRIRATIRKAAPQAQEAIKYRIPTFTQNGNLVHFAAFKNHIGFFPTSSGIRAFKKELSAYDGSTGTARFPYGQPLPLALISKIVNFRVKENLERAKTKAAARKRRARG